MNASNGSYNAQSLYGENDEPNIKYCRQQQPNHLCCYVTSCRYIHEQDSDYKGPLNVDDDQSAFSSSKVQGSGDQDPDKIPTPKGSKRIKPRQTTSLTQPITPPANPSKRLSNKP